jgi:DNA-directed RNA polymerase specialized sigma24 family protein
MDKKEQQSELDYLAWWHRRARSAEREMHAAESNLARAILSAREYGLNAQRIAERLDVPVSRVHRWTREARHD